MFSIGETEDGKSQLAGGLQFLNPGTNQVRDYPSIEFDDKTNGKLAVLVRDKRNHDSAYGLHIRGDDAFPSVGDGDKNFVFYDVVRIEAILEPKGTILVHGIEDNGHIDSIRIAAELTKPENHVPGENVAKDIMAEVGYYRYEVTSSFDFPKEIE